MVYLLYSFVFFFVGWIICNQKVSKKSFFVVYIGIVFFWGLSYIDAPDTPGYINKFNYDIESLPGRLDAQFEIGYSWTAALIKTIYPHYWFFQFVILGIDVLLIIKGLRYYFDDKILLSLIPLLFFIFPTNLAAFRQGIATSLFIYALHYIMDENIKKSLLYPGFILLAALFHQSAIMLILLYLLRFGKKYLSYNWVIILFLIFCDVIWLTGSSLLSRFGFLQVFFSHEYMDMGQKYTDLMVGASLSGTYGFAKVIEINIVVLLYTFFCKVEKENEILRCNLLLYVFAGLCFGGLVGHRLNYYWTILYYVCFVRGVMELPILKKSLSISFSIMALYMFWFFVIKSGYIKDDYLLLFSY